MLKFFNLEINSKANVKASYCNIIKKSKDVMFLIIMTILCAYTFSVMNDAKAVFGSSTEKYIVIIIDDYGNGGDGTEELLQIGIPITAAVMPGMIYSEEEAEKYYNAGCDIILHQPMEPKKGKREWLGPFALTSELSDEEIVENVKSGLRSVKYAVGINNHMGSKIMENQRIISQVIEVCDENDLIFIDSRTTDKNIAKSLAQDAGIRYYERDFFLDDKKTVEHTKKQMLKAAKTADKKGYSIVIGHVGGAGGKTTVEGISAALPELIEKGYKFITISELKLLMDTDMGLSNNSLD